MQIKKYFYLFIFLKVTLISHTLAAQEKKLSITPLAENTYLYKSYQQIEPWGMVGASGLVVIEGKDAYLIDTPWTATDTEKLLSWIKAKGLTIKAAIATHFHEDASGGLATLNSLGIATYASSLTNKLLTAKQKATATNEIDTDSLQSITKNIEIYYPGAGHSQDNIVVWLADQQLLFGGCFVKSLRSKNLGNIADAAIEKWPEAIENILHQYPNIHTVVPGHGAPGTAKLLHHTAALARDAASEK